MASFAPVTAHNDKFPDMSFTAACNGIVVFAEVCWVTGRGGRKATGGMGGEREDGWEWSGRTSRANSCRFSRLYGTACKPAPAEARYRCRWICAPMACICPPSLSAERAVWRNGIFRNDTQRPSSGFEIRRNRGWRRCSWRCSSLWRSSLWRQSVAA